MDPHSHAMPDRVRVRHLSLDLDLDFDREEARGAVRLDLDRPDAAAPLVLDAKALEILAVVGADGAPRAFTLGGGDALRGPALSIGLAPGDTSVTVRYRTTPAGQALQWLAPAQTHDGNRPFVFTQGESILTRTLVPLQDTPGVRFTWDAVVRCPEGLTPVMSAEMLGRGADGAWRFRMAQPVPSYLVALACGDLAFRAISDRCGVWAEPGHVEAVRAEFGDMESMVAAAEGVFGPYRWGRFDVLVLPAAFPFGGMENPRLTFATPTVIAGDKSLVSLVAHELAHSWSGNLVTNAAWRDLWLNEGFTVHVENRIMEVVYGEERAHLERQLQVAALERELAELPAWQQVLHVDLGGRDPDDNFTLVPYVKGALFLARLEAAAGRPRFDAFLRDWFDRHAFQSVGTGVFRVFLEANLPEVARGVDLDGWLGGAGLPADAPRVAAASLALVDRAAAAFGAAGAAAFEPRGWNTHQWLHFLAACDTRLDAAGMAALDARFGLTASGNAEIAAAWLRLAIRAGYAAADARLAGFLETVGRRKFLEPLYKELAKTPAGLVKAKAIYARARPRYHPLARGTVDGLLDAAR